MIQAVTSEDT